MNKSELTLLKIGGSVITDKSGELAARTQEIDRVTGEIKEASAKSLIVVHGGGSFGHPSAQKYRIKEGVKEASQKIGFAETHHLMTVLNGLVMDCLIWYGIPAVSVTPSSLIITESGRMKHFEDTFLRMLLQMGFTPVLYGDAVLDSKQGFAILSGDQLVSSLAMRFNAYRIVVGVDVDGLFNADPKVDKKAKLFTHLILAELKELLKKMCKPTSSDVTGGMYGKVAELLPAVERGIPVMLVNASKPGNISKVLEGKTVEGTIITKE